MSESHGVLVKRIREMVFIKGKLERAIVRAAMKDYLRLRNLGYDRSLYVRGSTTLKLWDACAAYNKRKGRRRG